MLASAARCKRHPLAQVPTWREQGVAADYVSYNGVLLPPAVDAEQIRFWDQALRVAASKEWIALVEKSATSRCSRGYVDRTATCRDELKATQALVTELDWTPNERRA